MTTARDIMSHDAICVTSTETAAQAAQAMAANDIGALPICDARGGVTGMVTDRDLTVHVMAAGYDPDTYQVGDLPQSGEVVAAAPSDEADKVLERMAEHKVRRIPVVDDGGVSGLVSQADAALHMPETTVGTAVAAVSEP
ncbi:CBS domain-containing protein [Salininema proteolyticum]|uniref:CBS domain-containing protein n=1 Tax=Salininema proteolyticum TaxID=1607685 RepID=A0ABV8U4L8_9ACTN